MPRLGNPLVYDLLDVAEALAAQTGRTNLRRAAMRRAVSTAYYAVFHALCFICASTLVGWSRNDLVEPIYRSLDHAAARKRLNGREAAVGLPAALQIGIALTELQEARHAADYGPPTLPVRLEETLNLIASAKRTILALEGLGSEDRLRLAVLLIAKLRLN